MGDAILLRAFRLGTSLLYAALSLSACEADQSRAPLGVPTSTSDQEATCDGITEGRTHPPADFEAKGKELEGDVTGDGEPERITVRDSAKRPEACRRMLVIEGEGGDTMTAVLEPLDWPSPDPKLRLLAEINGRAGLEVVVALSPAPAVSRSGAVFRVVRTELALMRLGGKDAGPYPHLLPFYDEFPAGVDCSDTPGQIVVTGSIFAPRGDDSEFGITRAFYRAEGTAFQPIDEENLFVDCCNEEASRRWPETADDPFRSCPDRVG